MLDTTERDYYVEAEMILKGLTGILATKEHLIALEEHYECRIIQIVNDLEVMKRKALNGL